MAPLEIFLSIVCLVLLIATFAQRSRYNKLRYICLTNARMIFYEFYGELRVKVFSETPWTGTVPKVYDVFSSPGTWQAKQKIAEERPIDKPGLGAYEEYEAGKWRETEEAKGK